MFIEIKATETSGNSNNKDTYLLNSDNIVSVERENESSIIKMCNGDTYRTECSYLEVRKMLKC
jgi:hypothetical protein